MSVRRLRARGPVAREGAEAEKLRAEAAALAEARAQAAAAAEHARASASEVIPYLRALKLTAEESRRAAAHCEAIPDAPLEERVRLALRAIHVRGTVTRPPQHAQSPGAAV